MERYGSAYLWNQPDFVCNDLIKHLLVLGDDLAKDVINAKRSTDLFYFRHLHDSVNDVFLRAQVALDQHICNVQLCPHAPASVMKLVMAASAILAAAMPGSLHDLCAQSWYFNSILHKS